MKRQRQVAAAFSQNEIDELARQWQRELKIMDWQIGVRIVRGKRLGGDDGGVNFEEKRREAFIMLLDPRDVAKDRMTPYDMEVTLVHELLHCALACFTGKVLGGHEDITQEQQIHTMSQTLVRLRRAGLPTAEAAA